MSENNLHFNREENQRHSNRTFPFSTSQRSSHNFHTIGNCPPHSDYHPHHTTTTNNNSTPLLSDEDIMSYMLQRRLQTPSRENQNNQPQTVESPFSDISGFSIGGSSMHYSPLQSGASNPFQFIQALMGGNQNPIHQMFFNDPLQREGTIDIAFLSSSSNGIGTSFTGQPIDPEFLREIQDPTAGSPPPIGLPKKLLKYLKIYNYSYKKPTETTKGVSIDEEKQSENKIEEKKETEEIEKTEEKEETKEIEKTEEKLEKVEKLETTTSVSNQEENGTNKIIENRKTNKKVLPQWTKNEEQKEVIAEEEELIFCQICICEIEEGEEVCELQCSHIYHNDCIEKWLTTNVTCPICRRKVFSEEELLKSHADRDPVIRNFLRQMRERNKVSLSDPSHAPSTASVESNISNIPVTYDSDYNDRHEPPPMNGPYCITRDGPRPLHFPPDPRDDPEGASEWQRRRRELSARQEMLYRGGQSLASNTTSGSSATISSSATSNSSFPSFSSPSHTIYRNISEMDLSSRPPNQSRSRVEPIPAVNKPPRRIKKVNSNIEFQDEKTKPLNDVTKISETNDSKIKNSEIKCTEIKGAIPISTKKGSVIDYLSSNALKYQKKEKEKPLLIKEEPTERNIKINTKKELIESQKESNNVEEDKKVEK